MSASLVGSEMCIRDSGCLGSARCPLRAGLRSRVELARRASAAGQVAVSYTHLTLPTICSV
eukprot:8341275-Alexandrium_andersonii.AAC.1